MRLIDTLSAVCDNLIKTETTNQKINIEKNRGKRSGKGRNFYES